MESCSGRCWSVWSAGLDSGGQLAWPQGSAWVLDVDGG
jgi:hypothetical protein